MSNVNKLNIVPPIEFDPGWAEMQKATSNVALVLGAGTSSKPVTDGAVANKNFLGWWLKTSATSGTARGLYLRLYLSSGAGGEAVRLFTTVENNAPADTANGAHISLSFGSSAGNITGLGTAGRFTLHVPNRSLGGTTAPVMSEVWSDGASSANGGLMSFLRAVLGGNATGLAAVEDNINLIEVAGGSNASGNVVSGAGNEPTWSSNTYKIRVNLNGTTAYLIATGS